MVCCCIPKCVGSTPPGCVRLFRFPKDGARRQLWEQNCRRSRPDFVANNGHRLCEKHFDSAQFESHRQDGLHKLRPDAVPKLFDTPPALGNSPKKRLLPYKHEEHLYCKRAFSVKKNCDNDCELLPTHNSHEVPLLPKNECIDSELPPTQDNANGCEADIQKDLQLEIRRLKWQLEQSKKREENLEHNIAKFLNNDQIEKLKRQPKDKGHNIIWSSDTIQRCLAIRSVVGRNGYEYLRSLKFPLPTYRTLCRHIKNAPFAPDIQHDVPNWLPMEMESESDLLVDEMQRRTHVEVEKFSPQIVSCVSLQALLAGSQPGA